MTPSFLVLTTAAIAGATSCSSSVPKVAIRSTQDTVLLDQRPEGTAFNLVVSIRNDDSDTVYVDACFDAQRDIDGKWITVFTPVCGGSAYIRLEPGVSTHRSVMAHGSTSERTFPRLDSRMVAGRYRLRFGVGSADRYRGRVDPNSIKAVPSSPFTVTKPQ